MISSSIVIRLLPESLFGELCDYFIPLDSIYIYTYMIIHKHMFFVEHNCSTISTLALPRRRKALYWRLKAHPHISPSFPYSWWICVMCRYSSETSPHKSNPLHLCRGINFLFFHQCRWLLHVRIDGRERSRHTSSNLQYFHLTVWWC